MNIIEIIVCGVAFMIIGSLWYSPLLFARTWMKLVGFNDAFIENAKAKGMFFTYGSSFILSLITASAMSFIFEMLQITDIRIGFLFALMIWAAFSGAPSLTNVLYTNKPFKLWLIDEGYKLVYMLAMAIIIIWI